MYKFNLYCKEMDNITIMLIKLGGILLFYLVNWNRLNLKSNTTVVILTTFNYLST